jgi:flagellar basal body P-ring formation protein FlgA
MLRRILMIVACALVVVSAGTPVQADPVNSGREAEIREAVTAFVRQKTANLGCEIRLKRLTINGTLTLPAGSLEYEVVAPQQWEGWGSTGISVIARQGDRIVRNISLRVEIEALADMVVTVRQIDYGSIISTSDLALRKLDLSAVQGRTLGRIEDAAGKKARTTFKANAVVRSDQLEKVPLIKVGQMVTIIAENERMRITVTGKAKSAGAEGDTITVQNLNSLKELPARVIDAGTVQIVF